MDVKEHIEILGMSVRDPVTDRIGTVVSVSFDISGCVQAYVNPKVDKEGKVADGWWCDTKRLIITNKKPVLEIPSFERPPGGVEKSGFRSKTAPN